MLYAGFHLRYCKSYKDCMNYTGYHQVDIKITGCGTTGCLELKHGGEPS